MLVIRKEQIEILEGEMMKSFEDEMVEHLAEFSPALFKVIKDEQMREVVRFGIKRSDEEYGFTFRGPIRLYLELMLLFGSHFDSDPQYPWAIQILKTDAVQMDRAEQLHAKTLDYQEKVSGPDGVNTRKALEQLSFMTREPRQLFTGDFDTGIRQEMKRVFPQKASYIGEDSLTGLIREGRVVSEKYEFPTVRGRALMVVLMFAFGHGCSNDLLYPWISRTLTDERIIEPAAREERLEKRRRPGLNMF